MSFGGWDSAKYDDNATTLNNINANRYMQYLLVNDERFLDPSYMFCYCGNVTGSMAVDDMGLPTAANAWYHILYICHQNNNGYGLQLAFQFAEGAEGVIFQRRASGMTWGKWYKHVGTAI